MEAKKCAMLLATYALTAQQTYANQEIAENLHMPSFSTAMQQTTYKVMQQGAPNPEGTAPGGRWEDETLAASGRLEGWAPEGGVHAASPPTAWSFTKCMEERKLAHYGLIGLYFMVNPSEPIRTLRKLMQLMADLTNLLSWLRGAEEAHPAQNTREPNTPQDTMTPYVGRATNPNVEITRAIKYIHTIRRGIENAVEANGLMPALKNAYAPQSRCLSFKILTHYIVDALGKAAQACPYSPIEQTGRLYWLIQTVTVQQRGTEFVNELLPT
jgi:hypothetical protein